MKKSIYVKTASITSQTFSYANKKATDFLLLEITVLTVRDKSGNRQSSWMHICIRNSAIRFSRLNIHYMPLGDTEKVRDIVGRWDGFTRDRRRVLLKTAWQVRQL